uniref:Uncharacterized protein n=3 Tax=Meloidogyne enterolobii TaxID=390850 RepID=A0A6V7WRB2_MELEN|nr:unnamed protein product [Meloidogyne enterolobii]
MDKYINIASQLNCDFSTNCLWANAPSDGLLDNSDFYLFQKNNDKTFPLQVGPGNSNPEIGTYFAFAGNLTKDPNHATLISAPIACQSTTGILSFELKKYFFLEIFLNLFLRYWLYNNARIEVIVLKVNPTRGHLTVIERPITDCHYLKPNGLCQVEIKRQPQPFRLALRGFKLNDQTIGSFVLLTKIKYEANLCGFYVNVSHTAHWSIGEKTYLWEQIVRTPSKPSGQFYFQFIDPIAEFPLPQLRSVLVPCTQSPSTLSFKFWLSPGVQAQICTLGTDNVALSCVYLNEADVPGPLTVDIDTADHQPFRFAFNVLRVDREANGGGAVIALDEIKYNGWLCHEQTPTTSPSPIPPLASLLQLRPLPTANSVDASLAFPNSLECDFEQGDLCPHWMHNSYSDSVTVDSGMRLQQRFRLGLVPRGILPLPFPIDGRFRGKYSAVAVLDLRAQEEQFAILTSRPIDCVDGGRVSISYFASPGAQLSVCANEQCVYPKENVLEVNQLRKFALNSARPFRIRIVAERNRSFPINLINGFYEPFVLIKRIAIQNKGFCRLKSSEEITCNLLKCLFNEEGICRYKSLFLAAGDVPFVHKKGEGISAHFTSGMRRAVLRSPNFRISLNSQIEMHLIASLSTFGSRLYICPNDQQQQTQRKLLAEIETMGEGMFVEEDDTLKELGNCEPLLGPKVVRSKMEHLIIQLDPEIRHFSLVAIHDKFEQFGDAQIVIHSIKLNDLNGQSIC